MAGESDLHELLKTMQPVLNEGGYVFCLFENLATVDVQQVLFLFKEAEGITVIVKKEYADEGKFPYEYVFSWITLNVFSSLEATGLTAAFSAALSTAKISCNVVASYNHDHIFVAVKDGLKAIEVLRDLSATASM